MNGNQAYILSKGYTKKSLDGVGALKGSPATIKSIVDNGDGTHTITFEWESNSGVKSTSNLIVADGADGKSVASVAIDGANHLIVTLDDSATIDAGLVPTAQGESAYDVAVDDGYSGTEEEWLESLKGDEGFSPTITVKESTDERYVLTITNESGDYDTPNLKGSGGADEPLTAEQVNTLISLL